MSNRSLDSVITEIVKRLDAIRPDDELAGDNVSPQDDPLRFITAFAMADPVLAALHKEYLEHNNRHKGLALSRGLYDPMTEVAADMLDSARSALQTRLLELQALREEEARAALERRLKAQKAADEAAFVRVALQRRQKNRQDDLFFLLWMLGMVLNRTMAEARRTLSAANDFMIVSCDSQRQRTRA